VHTDIQADTQTDKLTHRQTHKLTHRQTDQHTDRQIATWTTLYYIYHGDKAFKTTWGDLWTIVVNCEENDASQNADKNKITVFN